MSAEDHHNSAIGTCAFVAAILLPPLGFMVGIILFLEKKTRWDGIAAMGISLLAMGTYAVFLLILSTA